MKHRTPTQLETFNGVTLRPIIRLNSLSTLNMEDFPLLSFLPGLRDATNLLFYLLLSFFSLFLAFPVDLAINYII